MAELQDAREGSFQGFEPYTLNSVQVTDRELGRGSYAAVVELEYRGLKCAGKKIYQAISSQGMSYALRRFSEECRLLSQMRHPNVVQFLGVCFERQVRIPILVMEYLHTNLSSCIDQYGILPKEINYSILHDVSLGLNYLHGQTPPIIHRDLSANNVLLTSNMTAKISDLGVAKILNLTPVQMSRMTETPGTPTYMPPEVMIADPKYDTSVDVFSYGIMMIHVFSGKWPHPKSEPVRVGSDGQLIPVSEAERREEYLCDIGQDHPLMDLILRCIKNGPKQRGSASEIVQRLKDAVLQFPPSIANKVEMMSQIKTLEEEKRDLVTKSKQKDGEIECRDEHIIRIEEENSILREHHQKSIERLELAYSTEVKQLQLQVRDMRSQIEMTTSEKEAIEIEMKEKITLKQQELSIKEQEITAILKSKAAEISSKNIALAQKDNGIKHLNDQLRRTREYLSSKPQSIQATFTWKQCAGLPIANSRGQSIVINNKVYYGGFSTGRDEDSHTVYCYDPSQDTWSTLPPLPVKWFGLGQVRRQLVAVGGKKISDGKVSNEVYVFDGSSTKWKNSFPSMPTARHSPAVVSHSSALLVAGGDAEFIYYIDTVEIFNAETSLWCKTDSLPTQCQNMSTVIIGNTCYLVGGYNSPYDQNQVLCASVDQLLRNATPLNQAPANNTQNYVSAWKKLADTPNYHPTATVVANTVLSIGGRAKPEAGDSQSSVYMYSPSTNSWIYVTDLPAPRYLSSSVVLSPTEILVIGGWDDSLVRQKNVYKGTLNIITCT